MAQMAYARLPKQVPSWIPVLVFVGIIGIAHGELRSSHNGPTWIVWPTILSAAFAALLVSYLKAAHGIVGGRLVAFVGRISFSIYVWQYVVFGAVQPFLPMDGRIDAYLLDILVAIFAVLPAAAASYYVIEKPFLELRVRYLKPEPIPAERTAVLS